MGHLLPGDHRDMWNGDLKTPALPAAIVQGFQDAQAPVVQSAQVTRATPPPESTARKNEAHGKKEGL